MYELKLLYRRLAMLHHPDHGGNPQVMKQINAEYQEAKMRIETRTQLLSELVVGDIVFVNDTKCFIKSCNEDTFTAKAIDRKKSAVFSRETGVCIHNPGYIAYIQHRKTKRHVR